MTERATALWTELVEAMRADGLIAHCVTKSGPATTAVVLKAVSTPPWVKADIKPEPGTRVLGRNKHGKLAVVYWSDAVEHWLTDADEWEFNPTEWRFL